MIAGVPTCPHLEWELVLTQFQSLVQASMGFREAEVVCSFRIRRGKDMEKKKGQTKSRGRKGK